VLINTTYSQWLKAALIGLTLLYPAAIYFGLQQIDPRYLALLLIAVGVVRLLSIGESPLNHWLWLPLLCILGLLTWLTNEAIALKLYPVLVSSSFLIVFAWSLRYPPTMIERIARLKTPQLSPYLVNYTRIVTKVWCVFFAFNGSIALVTALISSDRLWALYNGFISYLLMATLFVCEWLIRQRVIKNDND